MTEIVSVIIPSYKDAKLLPKTLDKLLQNSYPNKEIIVVIDEPTKESLKNLQKFSEKIILMINPKRQGKVNAYKKALERAKGEYLIFLDDDIEVVNDNFVEKIVENLKKYDFVDVRKEIIRDSLLSRLVYYDYMAMNLANYLFYRWIGRCVGVNGAAFAIRRKALEKIGGFQYTVSEDLDLGIRAYLHGLSFVFLKDLAVLNKAPKSLRDWFKQRKRWAIGAGIWIKKYFRSLVSILKRNLKACLFILFTVFPNLLIFIISLFLEESIVNKLFILLLFYLSSLLPMFIPVFTLISYSLAFLPVKTIIVASLGFIFYSIIYYWAAKKLGHKFNILEFAAFYFVYSPIWLLILLTGIFRVTVLKKTTVEDWVV